jgi:hypothetical protein
MKAIVEAGKRDILRLEAAKLALTRLDKEGLYDEYLALSRIPVCIIGDGVIRGSVHGDIANEAVFKRVNIRVVGVRGRENVGRVQELFKKSGVADIVVIEYGELRRLANAHKEYTKGNEDKETDLVRLIKSTEGKSGAISDRIGLSHLTSFKNFANI